MRFFSLIGCRSISGSENAPDECACRLDELVTLGVEDNTYFFFTCDNGYHIGQHRMPPGKREVYQHDINVPFIVSGPRIVAKSTVEGMAGNYDLAPTWAALAGATPSASAPPVDGKSIVPLLLGKAQSVRTYTLQEGYQSCEAGHGGGHICRVRAPGGEMGQLDVYAPSLDSAYSDDETEVYSLELGSALTTTWTTRVSG